MNMSRFKANHPHQLDTSMPLRQSSTDGHATHRRHKYRRRALWIISAAALLTASFFGGRYTAIAGGTPLLRAPQLFKPSNALTESTTLHQENVLAIGGSMAYGWKDANNDSYIERAFAGLSASTNVNYTYYNHAIVGASTANFITQDEAAYKSWLNTLHPGVVVISFGLLDDMVQKTTPSVFESDLKTEISLALSAHAVVLVVTPPVTYASYTSAAQATSQFITEEKQVVNSFHGQNVKFFDLYDQMLAYLAAHHQTYQPYEGDNWHPNTAGHILAGSMLENDIVTVLGQGPLVYK
jgi:lysophospholipase L1-like esterase